MYIDNEPRYPWVEGFDDVITTEIFGPHPYYYPTEREQVVEGMQIVRLPLSSADFGIYYCDELSHPADWPCDISRDAVEYRNKYYRAADTLAYCKGVHAAIRLLGDF